jgi:hypothetical protein
MPTENQAQIIDELRSRIARLERTASKAQQHFDQGEAAEFFGRSREWLRRLHLEKRGPKHKKRGRYRDYTRQNLEDFDNGVTESD